MKTGASQEEDKELTDQFYVTLRAMSLVSTRRGRAVPPNRSRRSKISCNTMARRPGVTPIRSSNSSLTCSTSVTWRSSCRAGSSSASRNLRPVLAHHYVKLAGSTKSPAERRAILARLVNDIQWRYTVNEVKRTYSKDITKITGLIFIVAIASFAAAVLGTALFGRAASGVGNAGLLLLAGLSGGWGAGFSMLASLKSRMDAADLNDLKLMKSRWILWSRPLIGVGGACILYFFLVSGLLGGTAFPALNPDQLSGAASPSTVAAASGPGTSEGGAQAATAGGLAPRHTSRDLALLIVWCFVAGFSERMVPALLAKTEGRAIGQSALGPDFFKPSAGDTANGHGAAAGVSEKRESRAAAGDAANGQGGGAAAGVSERRESRSEAPPAAQSGPRVEAPMAP